VLLAYWFIVLKSLGSVLPNKRRESLFFTTASACHSAIDTRPPAPLTTARRATTGTVYLFTRINRIPNVVKPVGTLLETVGRILFSLHAQFLLASASNIILSEMKP
jgi:hypothetical protein